MIRSFLQDFRSWLHRLRGGDAESAKQQPAPLPQQSIPPPPNNREEAAVREGRPGPHREKPRKQEGLRTPERPAQQRRPSTQRPPAARPIIQEPWDISKFQVPPAEGKTRFHDLDLPLEIMHAVADLGFQYCTPIQTEILPHALARRDAAGRAQTGTGKSAAFLITILTHFLLNPAPEKRRPGTPRALIMAPTRELALQIKKDAKALAKYTPFQILSVYGGMEYQKQLRFLTDQLVDIVVATPGRLLDFKKRGNVHLSKVEILVIDEADRMLDMGFIPDMRRIIEYTPPKTKRQTMLFGATLTPQVLRLASSWTKDAVMIEIAPEQVAVDTVDQRVYITTTNEKFALLYNLITKENLDRVIVFGNRRDATGRLADYLSAYGISCGLLNGDVEQKDRLKTLEAFRTGKFRVLVATDVAGRGLHIEGVSHVVNYNLPQDPEDYVHRIGRTGRAGASGISVSFATEDDSFQIPAIEKYMGRELRCVYPPAELLTPPPPLPDGVHRTHARRTSSPRGRPQRSGGRRR